MALTAEQAERWLAALQVRRSRRSYDGTPVAAADLEALRALAREFRPFGVARVAVIERAPQAIFAGIVGSYGGISGSPSAMVFIGRADDGAESAGYVGEALVLEATARGLNTCWVGGLFSSHAAARAAECAPDEHVCAVSPLGHAVAEPSAKERVLCGIARPKVRLDVGFIAPGCDTWPTWARAAAEAVRPAPSAMNHQPWRLRLEDDSLVIGFAGPERPRVPKRLDCGIAMLHAEVAARHAGVTGEWVLLESPDVARFVVRR